MSSFSVPPFVVVESEMKNTVIIPTGWDRRFWNCDHPDVHSGDQQRSIFSWGTRVRIDFTREKITLPTP